MYANAGLLWQVYPLVMKNITTKQSQYQKVQIRESGKEQLSDATSRQNLV